MCGIAGFSIAPDDFGKIDTRSMTVVLGYEMQSRGKDATGILTVDPRGRWKLRKRNIPADVFLAGREGIGCSASSLLLHTRAATQGKATNNGNNHPIQYGDVIGIHNGIIWNDDKLFAHYEWKRNNEVDSEAIFAALHHLPQDDALTNIDGGWAIAWVRTGKDDDPRRIWLARGQQSPMFYALTANGSVVFASTHGAVKDAFKFGDVTGDPTIIQAPEGFLAHTNPEGGLTVLPQFDGSGEHAIGARKKTVYTSGYTPGAAVGYGHAWGGTDHTDDWMSRPSTTTIAPTPNVRIQITGIKSNPKVGDRRKYWTRQGEWIFETCTSVSPPCWAELHESKLHLAHPGETVRDKISVGTSGEAVVLPFGNAARSTPKLSERLSESERDAAAFLAAEERAAFIAGNEADFMAANDKFGYAHEGDLICIPKKVYSADGRNDGGIIGIVTEIHDDQLLVEWRPGHLSVWDEYEILIRAAKGG